VSQSRSRVPCAPGVLLQKAAASTTVAILALPIPMLPQYPRILSVTTYWSTRTEALGRTSRAGAPEGARICSEKRPKDTTLVSNVASMDLFRKIHASILQVQATV
jgi:hypothetical protein